MKQCIPAALLACLATSSIAQPIDESAKVIQDETYFLASQGISIWQEDVAGGELFWVSLHDYKISPDGTAFSARLRGYHKANRAVPYRLSVTQLGANCATNQVGVTNWRTYSAKSRMIEDRPGNIKGGEPFTWPMLRRLVGDLCVSGLARKP